MSDGVEVWSGGVNTWECDEMGHLNVRFWVAKAMEGLGAFVAELGLPRALAPDAETTFLVQEHHIRFLKEARAGAALWMSGAVVELGEGWAQLVLVIRHPDGTPGATFQTRILHVDTADLSLRPWPQRVRDRSADLMGTVPAYAAARSVELGPVASQASLPKALDLGMTRIGLGIIGPDDLDIFGRMRPELFIGRVSDGVARLFGETRPGPALAAGEIPPRIGGAVLEYRVLYHSWPRAGDRNEIRSGFAEAEPKTRRVMHWMLDPESGKPWVTAEAIVISFDLDRRKVIEISPEALASFEEQVLPGLCL